MSRRLSASVDPQALDAWILAVSPRAIAYARSLLRDSAGAEDVVQDCFCRLLAKDDKYDLIQDGEKLLFRSITNACMNLNTRERPLLSLCKLEDEASLGAPLGKMAHQPDQLILTQELEQFIATGLADLPMQQRAALELKSLGHSQQEVAEALEISVNHAGVLIHRARRSIAEKLAPYFEEQAG